MNEGDGLGMKVPCELVFNGQHRFIDIYVERFLRSVEIQP